MENHCLKLRNNCDMLEKYKEFSSAIASVQFSSVTESCPTLCDPMNCSTPGLPVYYQLPEFTQTHVHRVSDAIQPSHPLSSPSPSAPSLSQPQGLSQWVNSSHEVSKVLEFQLQHTLKNTVWVNISQDVKSWLLKPNVIDSAISFGLVFLTSLLLFLFICYFSCR